MIVLTGGAGFIGSCMLRTLNDMGRNDVLVVDHIASTDKWMNLCGKRFRVYEGRDGFLDRLPGLSGRAELVIHLGACSATTERDFDFLYRNNFEFTRELWLFCAREGIPFIYASSAATYGDGSAGFDDQTPIGVLRPLNAYGYSKQLFDLWAERQLAEGKAVPPQHVGLKFFNVYGPNEYHKGAMASVALHAFDSILKSGDVGLFRSYREGVADGGQLRDFVYVKDVCAVITFLMAHRNVSGLFNVGTGTARSFLDLASAVFSAMEREPAIRFIDMPEGLRPRYQYYTCARMDSLRAAGYAAPFSSVEDGVRDYVRGYLMHDRAVW